MNRFDPHTEQLLAAALAGVATPDQLAELNRKLATDDALLDEYLRLMRTDAALHFQHGRVVAPTPPAAAPARPASSGRTTPRRIAPTTWALSIAAAGLLAAAAVVVYFLVAGPQTEPPTPPSRVPVATLIESTDTVIYESDIANPGGEYPAGSYSIESGSAQFLLTNRVSVGLRGHTRLFVHSPTRTTLARGAARFVCPPGTEGFTVSLPTGGRIVDLGTEFDVRLDDNGRAWVSTIDGRVSVVPTDAPAVALAAGQSALLNNGRLQQVVNLPAWAIDLERGRIAWGSAQDLRGPDDITHTGTHVAAANLLGPSVEVNGVAFESVPRLGDLDLLPPDDALAGQSTGDPGLDAIVSTVAYGGGADHTVELTGLVPGRHYLLQLIYCDGREKFARHAMNYSAGGDDPGVTLTPQPITPDSDTFGQYVLARFVADAPTRPIRIRARSAKNAHLNAFVLRDITQPQQPPADPDDTDARPAP